MANSLLSEDLLYFFKKKEYVYVGTISSDGRPSVAPKFLIKIYKDFFYLADFVFGNTWKNLRLNPGVSLSIVNLEDQTGYQISGSAQLIERGEEYRAIIKDLHKREMFFSVERFIDGLHREKRTKNFEITFPDKLGIIKIKISEIVKIEPSGNLKRTHAVRRPSALKRRLTGAGKH